MKGQGKKTFFTTYALLDNGSNATFCTNDLLKELGVGGRNCDLSVATVNSVEEKRESTIISLEIADMNENVLIGWSTVFSTNQFPISEESIPKQEDVARWPT